MRVCERPGCEREIPQDAPENRVYCDGRCRTAHWRLKRETPKRVKPSGRQVSYEKAASLLAEWLHGTGYWRDAQAEHIARSILFDALPERQQRSML